MWSTRPTLGRQDALDLPHAKITLQDLGKPTGVTEPISGEEIRQVPE